ncbi:hypothetical protein WICPIJ_007082, partial [Wickerhamomyces pijperi]
SKSGAAVHEEQPFNVLFPTTDSVLNEPNTTTAATEEEEEQSETGIDEQVDDKEAKHKEELMQSLTNAEHQEPFMRSPIRSYTNNATDSLFNDSTQASPLHIQAEEIQSPPLAPTSASSPRRNLVNVYKKPTGRYRRGGNSISSNSTSSSSKTNDKLSKSAPNIQDNSTHDVTDDELGPLGQSLTEIDINDTTSLLTSSENAKSLYEQATTTPSFEINRTNIPTKDQEEHHNQSGSSDQDSQPEEVPQKVKSTLQISVLDPIKVGDLTSAHIVYTISTKVQTPSESDPTVNTTTTHSVTRRYTDFVQLYSVLLTRYPGYIIPAPPVKQSLGRFDDGFVELRRGQLENMLRKISLKAVFVTDDEPENDQSATDDDHDNESIFMKFLKLQKWEEGIVVHVNNHYDSDLNSNGSAGSSEKGFLSSIGGAFASLQSGGKRQFVETDEWFVERKGYFEKMEAQLIQFSKALEMIEQLRGDLKVVLDEFVVVLSTLADLEVSKTISEILLQFIDVEVRIKELLGRLSVQDLLTLGTTLEEYERMLKSVKKVFQQRDKTGVDLGLAEVELTKKKSSLDKASSGTIQLEKVNALKLDVARCQKRFDLAKTRHEDITKVIKNEVKRFERERIHDFRNTVEVYLEGLVEAQKESVELWESFYEKL